MLGTLTLCIFFLFQFKSLEVEKSFEEIVSNPDDAATKET
jgi:hypothetical protein